MLIWARSIGADLRAALISPPQHFTGAHLNIHVKTVTPQYSFHFFSPSVFISKSNMGHENMCMHKEYKPYDCSSAGGRGGGGGGGGWGHKVLRKNKSRRDRVLFYTSDSSFKAALFITWYCRAFKTERESVFVLFTFFSWPHLPKQRRAWTWSSTFWAFYFSPFSVLPPPTSPFSSDISLPVDSKCNTSPPRCTGSTIEGSSDGSLQLCACLKHPRVSLSVSLCFHVTSKLVHAGGLKSFAE